LAFAEPLQGGVVTLDGLRFDGAELLQVGLEVDGARQGGGEGRDRDGSGSGDYRVAERAAAEHWH